MLFVSVVKIYEKDFIQFEVKKKPQYTFIIQKFGIIFSENICQETY